MAALESESGGAGALTIPGFTYLEQVLCTEGARAIASPVGST
jgi:hypothetical protein